MERAFQAAKILAGECKKLTTEKIVIGMGLWSVDGNKKGKQKGMEKGRALMSNLEQDGRAKKIGLEWTLVGGASQTPNQGSF